MQIVNSTKKEPAATDPDAVTDWKTHELNARAQIQSTLEEEQLTGVMYAKDAKETWARILRRLQGKDKHSIALLIGELFCSTLSDEIPLPQLNAIQLSYNLHSLGQQLDDSLIAIMMIISLPDSYSTLHLILMATDLKQTSESVKTSVLQEEQLQKGGSLSTALQACTQAKPAKGQSVTQTRENGIVMGCPIQKKRTKKRTKEGARNLCAHTHLVASWGTLKINAMPNTWISWKTRAL
jgi:hypothetical protein